MKTHILALWIAVAFLGIYCVSDTIYRERIVESAEPEPIEGTLRLVRGQLQVWYPTFGWKCANSNVAEALGIDAPMLLDLSFPDDLDITLDWEPSPVTLAIITSTGRELLIDIEGDEVKITGDANMDEAAAVFFNKHFKGIADAYIQRKLKEPEPLADK